MKIAGKPVVDAKSAVRLKITARDVLQGNTKDPAACAAALACRRELHATEARVHIGRTYVKTDGKWIRYQTSEALRSEIIAFDRGGKFMPGEYTLLPAPISRKLGSKRPTGPKIAKGKPRKTYHVVAGIRAHGANR